MAKISHYPLTTNIMEDDVFLIDGVNGTRRIQAKSALGETTESQVADYISNHIETEPIDFTNFFK